MIAKRPNILLIIAEQLQAGAMGCAGNEYVHTPAIDGMMADGVAFQNAYAANPACTPSRAAMFTGLMPHQVGALRFGDPIAESFRDQELGNLLSQAGYDCVYGGKWHANELTMVPQHGFRNMCDIDDVELPGRCASYLQTEHDRPFFMVASFDNPHNICEWARGEPLPWGEIEVPADAGEYPPLPPNHEAVSYEPYVIELWRKGFYQFDFDLSPTEWRRYAYAYYRLIEKADRGIDRILTALRESPHADDTLVIFTSDHGEQCGAHRLHQKGVLYEESIHVPFIFSGRPVEPKNAVDDRLASNALDLYATICDYAGVEPPDDRMGKTLRPILESQAGDFAPHDYLAAEEHLQHLEKTIGVHNCHIRSIRTQEWKYIAYSFGPRREQLFHIRQDPGEVVNLAHVNRYRPVLQQHRDLLRRWCRQTQDGFGGGHYARPDVPFMVPGDGYDEA